MNGSEEESGRKGKKGDIKIEDSFYNFYINFAHIYKYNDEIFLFFEGIADIF
jgi:hypothetical protein